MDELAKRRFKRTADALAHHMTELSGFLGKVNHHGLALRLTLLKYVEDLERVTGPTPETIQIRKEIGAAWDIFEDIKVLPALDAALAHFSDAANDIATLVGAIPTNPPSVP